MAKKQKEAPIKQEKVVEEKKEVTPVPVKSGLKRIKVTQEELMKLQADCKLVGYDPATSEAIIR